MNNNEILGYFDGKDIFLDMGNNLRNGLSPSTYIHEIAHKLLNSLSGIGIVENMIKEHMEINQNTNNKALFDCILAQISKFTYEVHEIYANTIEMVEINRIYGKETWNKIYNTKPEQYKNYADYYLDIIGLNVSHEKVKEIILDHCVAGLYINVMSDEFMEAINKPETFIKYMNSQINPVDKLEKLKVNYIKYQQQIKKSTFYFTSHEELMIRLLEETPIKNDDCSYFRFMIDMYSNINKYKGLKNLYEKMSSLDIVKLISNNIKLLDFSAIRPVPLLSNEFYDKANGVVQIINKFELKGYKPKEEEYYIIFLDVDNSIYYSTIGEEGYIKKLLEKENIYGILILSEEFSEDFLQHKYLNEIKKDKYIIIRDFVSSIELLNEYITEHKILYTSINEDNGPGVITMFLFRDKQKDDTLFVFPTIKNTANSLMELIGDKGEFLGSKEFQIIFSRKAGLLSFGFVFLHLAHMNNHKLLCK